MSKSRYISRLFNILKALTVSQPFSLAWRTTVSKVLVQFVVPEGQTSTTPDQDFSPDENNLYTAIARLLLASAPSFRLREARFDTRKETHLLAFDGLLRLVAGLDDPKPTLSPQFLELLQMSMRPHNSRAMIDWAPFLVGPPPHYVEPTRYEKKRTTGAAAHATQEGYARMANATPSSSTGLFSPRPEIFVQFLVCPRYVSRNLRLFRTNRLQPRIRSYTLPVAAAGQGLFRGR